MNTVLNTVDRRNGVFVNVDAAHTMHVAWIIGGLLCDPGNGGKQFGLPTHAK